jgi:hypothetical protein
MGFSDFPTFLFADNDNTIKIPEDVAVESGLEGVWIAGRCIKIIYNFFYYFI